MKRSLGVAGITALGLCAIPSGRAAAQAAPAPDSTVIVTLGTGTPRPLPDVMGPATAIVVGKRVFLVDAGVGVERRLADVLIHEVQPTDSARHPGSRSAADWAAYLRAYHTTAVQLGELAARVEPKLLIVSHDGRRVPREQLLGDIRKGYAGQVVMAEDLGRY